MTVVIQQGLAVPLGRGSDGLPKVPELASGHAMARQAAVAGTRTGGADPAAQELSGAYGVASQRETHETNTSYDTKRVLAAEDRGQGGRRQQQHDDDEDSPSRGQTVDVET